jgi:hypothetical protein
MTSITWTIARLDGVDVDPPLDRVLSRAYWVVTATKGSVSASRSNNVKLTIIKERDGKLAAPYVDPETYIHYTDVSEQDVVRWVKNILGDEVAVIERSVLSELESKLNLVPDLGPQETPLPWGEE